MGSISRMARADRFIKEFGDEILTNWALDVGCCITSRALAFDESSEMVHIFYGILRNGNQDELMSPVIFFNLEGDEEEMVQTVCEFVQIEEDEARKRLKKAELI